MPTVTRTITASTDDYFSNTEGTFGGTFQLLAVNTFASNNSDNQGGFRFAGLSIPRYARIDSLTFKARLNESPPAASTVEMALEAALNPGPSTDPVEMRARALATARVMWPFLGSDSGGDKVSPELKTLLQERVDKGDLATFILRLRDSDRGNTSVNRRLRFHAFDNTSGAAPSVTITWSLPERTGSSTFRQPAGNLDAQIEVSEATTGTATFRQPAPRLNAEAEVGTPTPRTARATFRQTAPRLRIYGGEGDPKQHTLFTVEPPYPDTHHLVTEAGDVFGFSTAFDETLGTPRTEVLGLADDAWFPASNLDSREPATLTFTAFFTDRDDPQKDRDRFARALINARQLILPDGRILPLARATVTSRPGRSSLGVAALPRRAYPLHPLLSGTISAAFETAESEDELPIYAIDAAGGITAPLLQKRAARGQLLFGFKGAERGILALASVGTPIAADGSSQPGSVTLSYQGERLVVSVRGRETRFYERDLTTFGAVLVCLLRWSESSAKLITVTAQGRRMYTLAAGPLQSSPQLLTAGVRADGVGSGAFMALGSHSLGTAFYKPTMQSLPNALGSAQALYDNLTKPGMTWAVEAPDAALELHRTPGALTVAPGESLVVDYTVTRSNYTGPLTFSATLSEGLSAEVSSLGEDTYRVVLSAPAATPEGSQTLRAEIKAQGADNQGSLLADVRDADNAIIEVAAGPAIAPNATAVRFAFDPALRRVGEMLRDSSGNGNTFVWAGLARPDLRYMGLLATGRYGAAIFSDALQNNAQAHRMTGNQAFCMIWSEVAKTPQGGVMYQVASASSDDGVILERAQGGFKIRTVHGATQVLSPDTLSYSGGRAELALQIGAAEITLRDRSGRSIRLNRPAWADAAVRNTVGALRSADGVLSSVTRAHLLVDSMHPYALSLTQEQRNIDALLPYVPESDVDEAADEAVGIFWWEDDRKYVNDAAPALGITAVPIGDVLEIPGGVYPQGGGAHVLIDTGLSNTEPTTIFTKLKGISSPDTTEYNAQVAFADSVRASASAELARHNDGRPFAMIRNNDFYSTHGYAGGKPVPDETTHRLVWNPPQKSFEVWSYYSQSGRIVKSNNTYPGTLKIGLGAIPRANGSNAEQTETKNIALIICRGVVNAETDATTKAIVESA